MAYSPLTRRNRYRLVAPAHPCARDIRASLHIKTPYRDGTTDVVFEPLEFMARLAALVPTPRVNLTRYHGVFAPNHRLREQITPARRGRRKAETANELGVRVGIDRSRFKSLQQFGTGV